MILRVKPDCVLGCHFPLLSLHGVEAVGMVAMGVVGHWCGKWDYLIEVSAGTTWVECGGAQWVSNLDTGASFYWRAVDDRKRRRTWMGTLEAILFSCSRGMIVVGAAPSISGGGDTWRPVIGSKRCAGWDRECGAGGGC